MKNFSVMALGLLMAGCVQLQPPTSDDNQAWNEFGQAWAMKGYVVKSRSELEQDAPSLSSEQYKQYQTGYSLGKDEYCQQDPFVLGLNGRIYYGICQDVSRTFLDEYWRGKQSRAKR
ncbi:DUF2799 domain-containing protein [Vibrio methylphosphonaticus]|uniref:DUF2799 domain-containing protein n=1 Tax=Vibrio methylphosphonaticus TaxID=2946866 RepID=UPI00202AB6E2|nr:DUF2799 domain-containing protein [Vibrio methylphosphonaticus]MCL9777080.1 DUF2799 domain-containing protein [Vibrio methylphosphonaticus]